jgi:hypothetical protein
VVGINGLTVSTDLGPAQVSWYPSIGLLLSVAGTEPSRAAVTTVAALIATLGGAGLAAGCASHASSS